MDMEKIITDLMEKRFNDKIDECIMGRFDDKDMCRRSGFDQRLGWFIEEHIDEYLKQKKDIILEKMTSKIDLNRVIIDHININLCVKEDDNA